MIYLREFLLPKDEWTDSYFSDGYPVEDMPQNMPVAHKSTAVNSWYPWNTLYGRGLRQFVFDDITILYGGNGSGKTTLLNIIAQTLKLSRSSRYNRSSFFDEYIAGILYFILFLAVRQESLQLFQFLYVQFLQFAQKYGTMKEKNRRSDGKRSTKNRPTPEKRGLKS